MAAAASRFGSRRTLVALLGCAVFAWALFRTAWMCDDAFITLRTIDNFVNGFGLRWNAAERVQSFTHPLWLVALTPFYGVTREPYFTTLAVQGALALSTVWLMLKHVAQTTGQAWFGLAVLVSSKAFVDFSTSGLENPLTHLLLVAFFLLWRARQKRDRTTLVTAVSSGIVLCRPDLALLVAPVLASAILQGRRPVRSLLVGLLPLAAWEVFSLVYYGSLVPNTALAKLSTGVPTSDLIRQGWDYWVATARIDPMTVAVIATGAVVLSAAYGRAGRLMGLGVALHALFIFGSGGDFMSGRFLTATLGWIVLGLVGLPRARQSASSGQAGFALAAGVVVVVGLFACDSAPLISRATFAVEPSRPFDYFGVTDERRTYYPSMGLLRRLGDGGAADADVLAAAGTASRHSGPGVRMAKMVGIFGYYAGPEVHVVDEEALCDPFLARLPAEPGWRIGHFERDVPEEYLKSLRDGNNALTNPRLHQLYADVRDVTQGPIWRADRFRTIVRLMFGGR